MQEHLESVAKRAAGYGAKFAAQEMASILGRLHDLGKDDPAFFPCLAGAAVRHDHSAAGACVAAERFGTIGKLLAYAIAGHHAGRADEVRDERGDVTRRSL